MATTIFLLALALAFYTYFAYPLILHVVSRLASRAPHADPAHRPPVSLIIAAYNEAKVIADKLDNCLMLDYPPGRLEVIVASDGSDDGTNEIVQRYAARGIRLNALPRGGKTRALNQTVPMASHEIVVFSDSNAMFRQDAIAQLTRHFADPAVGAVSGDVRLVNDNPEFSESEGLYYRYERAIQAAESAIHSMIGVDGAMYAVRKSLYRAPSDDIICDDFVISMNVLRDGHRVIYSPAAIATEDSAPSLRQELRRRSRYIAATTHALLKGEGLPRPSQWLAWWMYLSHKLLRWLVPVFLIAMLVSNALLLDDPLWRVAFAGQVLFYLAAAAGFVLRDRRGAGLLRIPFYFCLQNLGALMGLFRGPLKLQKAAWVSPDRTVLRRPGDSNPVTPGD